MKNVFVRTLGCGVDLVLIHGFGFNSDIWQSLAAKLAHHYRVTFIDLPGFGRSSSVILSQYDLMQVCASLLPVLPKEAIYLGWSFGGLIASCLALHYSARVTQLINVAMSPCFRAIADWPGISPSVLQEFIQLAQKSPRHLLLHLIALLQKGRKHASVSALELKKIIFNYETPNPQMLSDSLQSLAYTDLRAQLSQLSMPQLYVFGEYDPIVPILTAVKLKDYLCSATIKILPTGHLPFLEQEATFIHLLKQFIDEKNSAFSA